MMRTTLRKLCVGANRKVGELLRPNRPERVDHNWFLGQSKAVIHIGANEGHERELYASYSLPVLWVEALPDVYIKLLDNIRGFPNQIALNALVTDKDGDFYDFHVSSNSGESSSIYDLDGHSNLWPDVRFTKTIKLCSTTLPTLLFEHGLSQSAFDTLVLDVQGAELLVILGAADVLKSLRFIKAEAADFSSYKGACTVATLSQALKKEASPSSIKNVLNKREELARTITFCTSALNDTCI